MYKHKYFGLDKVQILVTFVFSIQTHSYIKIYCHFEKVLSLIFKRLNLSQSIYSIPTSIKVHISFDIICN